MTTAHAQERAWRVTVGTVGSTEAAALLREYYIEVSDRYYQLHCGRTSTPAEIWYGKELGALTPGVAGPGTGASARVRTGATRRSQARP